MLLRSLIVMSCISASGVTADIVIAERTMRPKTVISADDIGLKAGEIPGTYDVVADVIGLETRVAIYAGRPINVEDVGPPATIERNQIVALIYNRSGLKITTDGRALGRGAPGERVRVMNLSSKSTLTGTIREDGAIEVQ